MKEVKFYEIKTKHTEARKQPVESLQLYAVL